MEDFIKFPISLLICGDVCPTKSNRSLFELGDVKQLVGDLIPVFKSVDYRTINLECALTETDHPIFKCGPNLKETPGCINGIAALGVNLVSMANNHILDYGEDGLRDTLKAVQSKNLDWVGIGKNAKEARRIFYKEIKGRKVAFIAVCEREFSGATINSAGANLFDPFDTIDDIEEARRNAEYVIVFYHGGKEYVPYPSPNLQKICRAMVRRGADYVFCQHSHCVGCYEKYQDGYIIYGQGNFIFDHSNHPMWQTGLLIKMLLGESKDIEFVPICKKQECVELAVGVDGETILKEFHARSSKVNDPEFISSEWEKFCMKIAPEYLHAFHGSGRIFRGVDRKLVNGDIIKTFYNKRKLCSLNDYVACDAHLDVIRTFLGKAYK